MRTRRIAGIAAAGVAAVLLAGCAVGQAPNGRLVLGLGVADSGRIETPTEQLEGVAGLLPPPWDKAALGLLGVAGAGYGRERGRHKGWDERESAGFAQQPFGGRSSRSVEA